MSDLVSPALRKWLAVQGVDVPDDRPVKVVRGSDQGGIGWHWATVDSYYTAACARRAELEALGVPAELVNKFVPMPEFCVYVWNVQRFLESLFAVYEGGSDE